ncbi:hypothetical protein PBI_PEAS_48 [Arthrobacter phage Peas]|uniref:Uncharacterized protein n=1 Tax=Arthrobacter phage Peas TaxID=2419965 RepID=A0A3G2KIA9_9CAUD|nr:hypothetical protein HOU51_gp48 [Arthrobacter phage Peas]AYN58735.1 hypothetical protein PBI_PEAS_48 [Arthrobacter phage Peas]
MPTRDELPEFARNHQLGKLARRTEPVYTDDGDLTDQEVKHVATEGDYDADTELVDDPAEAEVVLSATGKTGRGGPYSWLKEEPLHRPIIDLDFPAALLPSSTPGHHHLYIDKEMPWSTYKALLSALAEAGLIELGYRDASLARNFTSVRMPSVKKLPEQPAPDPAPL